MIVLGDRPGRFRLLVGWGSSPHHRVPGPLLPEYVLDDSDVLWRVCSAGYFEARLTMRTNRVGRPDEWRTITVVIPEEDR